ncbi:MAG TPA: PBSX family phage terminase large subunit [Clostridia bacterium]|nr:PBSX family phage terminase large subunit [Clostridia bacterium]
MKKIGKAGSFSTFSEKQLQVLSWWCPSSPNRECDAIICDGAVRSGKTVCMSISFVCWALCSFEDASFAICGKTIASLKRNVVRPVVPLLREIGFDCKEKLSQNFIDISHNGRTNRFYLFGGKDEGSASLIQGMTLSGILLDEVALMPRSFVEQAIARCSLEGSRMWFNCNPENPLHWFHEEWIKKSKQKNCLYLHFKMDDNPSLTPSIIARYKSLYSGAFYERFVEGKWVAVHGLVYPMFHEQTHVCEPPRGAPSKHYISCD